MDLQYIFIQENYLFIISNSKKNFIHYFCIYINFITIE